jgi:hypothetical protein
LGPTQCYSTSRSNRQRPARVRTELGRDHPPPSAVTTDCYRLPPDFHALHMQQPTVCSASSQRPDTGPACATAARPPTTSWPTLPTSRHFHSTRRACNHRLCTLPLALGPEEKPITTLPTVTVELPPLHSSPPWPPSTAASAAPLAPSTLLVALPELKGALQPSQPQPADHLTGRSPAVG